MDDSRMRNLSVKQTLDELLGISRESKSSSSDSTNRPNSSLFDLNSSMRPPTRHGGRDSASSNEENRDPSTSTSHVKEEEKLEKLTMTNERSLNDSDDDFIKRLSEMRKQTSLGSGRPSLNGTTLKGEKRASLTVDKPAVFDEAEEHLPLSFDNSEELSSSSERSRNGTYRKRNVSSEAESSKEQAKSENNDKPKPKERQTVAPIPARRQKSLPKKSENKADNKDSAIDKPPIGESEEAYLAWKKNFDEKEREQKRLEKEEWEKKQKEESEKKLMAQKQFERWKQERDEQIKERRLKEKEKRMKESEQKAAEKAAKKKDAEKAFESWKRERSKSMHQIQMSKKLNDEKRQREEEERKKQAQIEAQTAFQAWLNKKKDEKRKAMEKLQKQLKAEAVEEDANEYKKLLADEAYQTWLQLKEADSIRHEIAPESHGQLPPWIPPNNTVPWQFTSTGKPRRYTLERRAISHRSNRVLPRSGSAKSVRSKATI